LKTQGDKKMRKSIAISLLAAGALSLGSIAVASKAEAQGVRGSVSVHGGPGWGGGFRAGPRYGGARTGFRGAHHWGGTRYRHHSWPAAAIAGATIGLIGAAAAAPYYYDGSYGPYAYDYGYEYAPAYAYYDYDDSYPAYTYAYGGPVYAYGPTYTTRRAVRYRTTQRVRPARGYRTVRHYRHRAPVVAYGPTYRSTRTVRQRTVTRVRPARTHRAVRAGVRSSAYRGSQVRVGSRAVRSDTQVRVRAGTTRSHGRIRATVRR
jgi:hypothetical protein